MQKPHRFALNVRWMFVNIPCYAYSPNDERNQTSILGSGFGEYEIGDEK
jgi:hypothetical protein